MWRDATVAGLGRSRNTAVWLGIEAWQLGDLREARADYSHDLLDWMICARPGDTGRGGGWQWQWPDGTWRKRQPGLEKSAPVVDLSTWSCTRGDLPPARAFLGLAA